MFGYGRGFGFGYGFGRGFGYGRGYWPGNPTPYCRAYPWLPRGWWKWGYAPEEFSYPEYPYYYPGYGTQGEVAAIRATLKEISDVLSNIENRISELEKNAK